jgi:hypothetical protein
MAYFIRHHSLIEQSLQCPGGCVSIDVNYPVCRENACTGPIGGTRISSSSIRDAHHHDHSIITAIMIRWLHLLAHTDMAGDENELVI